MYASICRKPINIFNSVEKSFPLSKKMSQPHMESYVLAADLHLSTLWLYMAFGVVSIILGT